MIRTKIQLLLSAILLLTASCSCEQRRITSAQDAYGATLATQRATLGGGVVHSAGLNPLIKVDGEIQKNFHEEQTLAGIIVIPDGTDIKTAAEELRDTAHPQAVDTCTALLGGKGFAYYGSHVAEKQQGAVTITALSETIPLQAATTYSAYFILRRTQTGCVYHAPAGITFTTPALTTFSKLQMQRAGVKKNTTGTTLLDLESKVKVPAPPKVKVTNRGFWLTKQGGTNIEPPALVAPLLREGKSLPTATGLQPWNSNPDVAHSGGTLKGLAIEALNTPDTHNLLQKGATYHVHSYVVCKHAGQDYYIFSQNTKPTSDQDAYSTKLVTQQATLGGGVVHSAGLNPLIKVDGTIQENFHEEQTLAGIIVIPDGTDIKTAAKELESAAHSPKTDTYTALLGSKGFAYHGSPVAPKRQGAFPTIEALNETTLLQAATTYSAYFILSCTKTGCVYYAPAGITFTTPALTTLQMQKADVTKNATGTILLDLASDVTVPAPPTVTNQGFLLTKQGGTNVKPLALVAPLLRGGRSLPTATGLQPWNSNPDVAHSGGTLKGLAIEALNTPDTHNLLQKGATYHVHSYVVYKHAGQDYYIFSQNTKPAAILKTVVELQMDTATISGLIKNEADSTLDSLQLQFEGQITKQQGAIKPTTGFLATKTSDKDTAKAIVGRLLSSLPSSPSCYLKDPAKDDIIFNVGPVTGPGSKTWNGNVQSLLQDMLGKNYNIYCWLEDSGEVFISDSKQLKVPQADVSVTEVKSKSNLEHALLISTGISIKNPKNCTNSRKGLLFVELGHTLNQATLQRIPHLMKSVGVKDTIQAYSSKEEVLYVRGVNRTTSWSFEDNAYDSFKEKAQYQVYAWLRCNNALFVSKVASKNLQTYTKNNPKNFEEVSHKGEKYQVSYKNYEVRKQDNKRNLNRLSKSTNQAEIEDVLSEIFKEDGKPDTAAVADFISKMSP